MQKRIILLIIVAAFLGGVVGSITTVRTSSASFLDDVWNFLRGAPAEDAQPYLRSATTTAPYEPIVSAHEQAVINTVEAAAPTVVSIVITKDLPIIEQCPYDPFSNLPPEFREFFDQGFRFQQPCQKGTRREEVGGGSGFIIAGDGLIVTNRHVVADEEAEYTVLTNDGEKYTAKVLARDPLQDIAILKVNAADLPVARLGDSDSLRLGQTAIAIGNALGEFRNTVSVGTISGLSRTITASGDGVASEVISDVIQTDAAINPGNSGGPLLNLNGEVIGINTAIASGAQNIGFAIPINHAKRDITSVQRTGSISIPYLGVRYLMLDEATAARQRISVTHGALVRGTEEGPGVIPNSPAANGGVKAEDVILKVNSDTVDVAHPLGTLLQKYSVGDVVTLSILREGKEIEVRVTLEERPTDLSQ